ncbi:Sec63 Brl domain-containing protein [Spinellus fusiger]|nr:Sec63 Brl domain-containing protein [Spinellus fusiger]
MAQYAYDEEGFNFYYFLLSVISLCLVPSTAVFLYNGFKLTLHKQKKNYCKCSSCQQQRKTIKKTRSANPLGWINAKIVFIILGWVAVALLAYQLSYAQAPKAAWDPYEILGVSEGASLPEIKKVYKRLSLVYHPDKAVQGTEKESEEQFIQISKAYKVLTDEEVRKNYEQYGHPDGKQSFSMGVALPSKLVEGTNSRFVLLFYALAFGIGLPYYIASWWYNSRRHTKEHILNDTMAVFFKGLKEDAEFKNIVNVLSGAHEFKENVQTNGGDEAILKVLDTAIAEELDKRFSKKYESIADTLPLYRRKAHTLLYAYFLRIDIASKASGSHRNALLKDQRFIVEKSIHLLQGLLQIVIVKQWLNVGTTIMDMQQHLLQATFPGDPSIKQLPHIDTALLRKHFRSKKKNVNTIQHFLALSEPERKSFLKSLSEEQYLDVMEVANRVPKVNVCRAVFKVVGDSIITTGAIITFVLTLKNGVVDDLVLKKIEEENQEEDTMEEEQETEGEKLGLAHSPYYPGEKKPYWWIFLGDPKVNRILVPPRKVTDIVDVHTIRIPFAGPPKPGTYTFSLFVKSDTYAGADILQDIQLTIQDPTDLPAEEEVDDSISEPEDDSIAGQMKLMREQGFTSALAGGTQRAGENAKEKDESDSDSDSDDE